MGLRETIQNSAGAGIAIAVVCLLIAGYVLFGRGPAPLTGKWYYDLETGEIVAHDAGYAFPPVELPNGHEAVQLLRFACGDCKSGETFDGYLYKVTPEWIASQQGDPSQGPIATTGGQLVARVPEDGAEPQWVEQISPQGAQITDMRNRCSGKDRAVLCLPQ